MFKVVSEVPKPLLIFLNFCFFIVMVECLFLPSAPNHWFESQFPSLHCWFPIHFPLFQFSWHSLLPLFCDHTQPFLWVSWLLVFCTQHLIGWLSLHHFVVFFSRALICSFIWGIFFVLACQLHSKGQSLTGPCPPATALLWVLSTLSVHLCLSYQSRWMFLL